MSDQARNRRLRLLREYRREVERSGAETDDERFDVAYDVVSSEIQPEDLGLDELEDEDEYIARIREIAYDVLDLARTPYRRESNPSFELANAHRAQYAAGMDPLERFEDELTNAYDEGSVTGMSPARDLSYAQDIVRRSGGRVSVSDVFGYLASVAYGRSEDADHYRETEMARIHREAGDRLNDLEKRHRHRSSNRAGDRDSQDAKVRALAKRLKNA